jgi:hypothetical protein
VRIGEPARKHGDTDPDIRHAVRNATRRILLDDDLTMLMGPATDGALLEIGILDIEGDDPSRDPRAAAATKVPPLSRMR